MNGFRLSLSGSLAGEFPLLCWLSEWIGVWIVSGSLVALLGVLDEWTEA